MPLPGSDDLAMASWFDFGNGLGSARESSRVTFVLCSLSLVCDLAWDGSTGFFLSRKVILDEKVPEAEDRGFVFGSDGRGENNDESIASMTFWIRPNQASSVFDVILV